MSKTVLIQAALQSGLRYGDSITRKEAENAVGIAGRTFTSLAQGNVNVEMVSQGASEMSVTCVIQGQDAMKALNLIHRRCLRIKVEERRGRGERITYVRID